MRIENKKRGSEVYEKSLPPQSLRYSMTAIRIVSTYLGFVYSFFMRGRHDTKPKASQLS